MRPLAVVELTDEEASPGSAHREKYVSKILNAADIKILRVKPRPQYSVDALRTTLLSKLDLCQQTPRENVASN